MTLEKKEVEEDPYQELLTWDNPCLLPYTDKEFVLFTDSIYPIVYGCEVKEKCTSWMRLFNLPSGIEFTLGGKHNALLKKDKDGNIFVYMFGDVEWSNAIEYNLQTNFITDLNDEDDELGISTKNKISPCAKTCLFGTNYILITSKETELLIYDIKQNKIVFNLYSVFGYGPDDKAVFDSDILFPLTEFEKNEQKFFLLNQRSFTTFTITQTLDKNKKVSFKIDQLGMDNEMTNSLTQFATWWSPKDKVLFIFGGRDAKRSYMDSDKIILFSGITYSHLVSSVKLPHAICNASAIYMPFTDSFYIVGGNYQFKKRYQKTMVLKYSLFKDDIKKLSKLEPYLPRELIEY